MVRIGEPGPVWLSIEALLMAVFALVATGSLAAAMADHINENVVWGNVIAVTALLGILCIFSLALRLRLRQLQKEAAPAKPVQLPKVPYWRQLKEKPVKLATPLVFLFSIGAALCLIFGALSHFGEGDSDASAKAAFVFAIIFYIFAVLCFAVSLYMTRLRLQDAIRLRGVIDDTSSTRQKARQALLAALWSPVVAPFALILVLTMLAPLFPIASLDYMDEGVVLWANVVAFITLLCIAAWLTLPYVRTYLTARKARSSREHAAEAAPVEEPSRLSAEPSAAPSEHKSAGGEATASHTRNKSSVVIPTIIDPPPSSHGGSAAIPGWPAQEEAAEGPFVTIAPPCHPTTLSRRDIEATLDSALAQRPPQAFAGKYQLLDRRLHGGQAIIQYARSYDGSMGQFVIKFFGSETAYAEEEALYRDPAIAEALPRIFEAVPNGTSAAAESAFVAPNRAPYPHFIVSECGVTLADWLRDKQRSTLQVMALFQELAQLLAGIHEGGHVHRDLKPDNVLFMLDSQHWRLHDFGLAGRTGEKAPVHCTPAYAAPEVLVALEGEESITVDPAADVWSLGVLVYEAVSHRRPLADMATLEDYHSAARRDWPYAWEPGASSAAAPAARLQSLHAKDTLLACLSRDPTQRPSAAEVAKRISKLGNASTRFSAA